MNKNEELKIYNVIYDMDRHGNYYPLPQSYNEQTKTMAKFIHDNYDKFTDDELKIHAMKCIMSNDARRILLDHEFYNYEFENDTKETMSLQQVKKYIGKFFYKYQSKAGGFYIEDSVWSYYDNKINDKIPEYKIMFENTVDKIDFVEIETTSYIERLDEIFNVIAKNIKCTITINKLEGEGIISVQIWLKDKNLKPVKNDQDTLFDDE